MAVMLSCSGFMNNASVTYLCAMSLVLRNGMNFVFSINSTLKNIELQLHTVKRSFTRKIKAMQYYHMSAGNPSPGGVPEKEPPPREEPPRQPGPEVEPPPPPPGPPPPVPNEVPEHDIKRSPPNPTAEIERAEQIAEQDREDVQERSPDLFPDKTIMETGDSYDEEDSKVIPEE